MSKFTEWLEHLRSRMLTRHYSKAKSWFDRRDDTNVKKDFLSWRKKSPVYQTDLDEFTQLVRKVTDNDLL